MKKLKKEKIFVPSRPIGWAQLPAEVFKFQNIQKLLDNIFDRLKERHEILFLRQVHPNWNSVANSILERRTLQLWTKWVPSKRWTDFNTFSELKSLLPSDEFDEEKEKRKSYWKKLQTKKNVKPRLALFKHKEINPFPNNCVCLPSIPTLPSFLETFGHCLTSLEIEVVECLTTTQMHTILQQMPALKALTILEFHEETPENFMRGSKDSPPSLPSPNPYLTHLRIGNRYRNDEPHIVQWLIKMFATQLVSLELKNVLNFRPFDKEWSCELFQGLKRLKLTEPPHCLLDWINPVSFTFPVEHLAIVRSHMCTPDSFWQIMRFTDKFSSSLLSFHFQYFFRSTRHFEEIKEGELSRFPKMANLTVFNISQAETNMMDIIRKQFAPRFQNLKTLEFPNFDFGIMTEEEERLGVAAQFSEERHFWQLFPKLETILFPSIADPLSKSFVALKRPSYEI